jgi:hypothetical protein
MPMNLVTACGRLELIVVVWCLKNIFKKNSFFLFFYLLQINIFSVFKLFLYADIKNNFIFLKKHHFNTFISKKHFKKQPQPLFQTDSFECSSMFFL